MELYGVWKLQLKDDLAGKRVKCPRCDNVVLAPQPDLARVPHAGISTAAALPDLSKNASGCDMPSRSQHNDSTHEAFSSVSDAPSFLAPPQSPDEIGRLGSYRVLRVLGQGGMGMVLEAEDPHLKRHVALKVMLPQFVVNTQAKLRFSREAQAAAALEHDHIISIFQVSEDRGIPFLAMPLLKGEALATCLKREGKLPLPDVLRIGTEIADGLAAAHAQNLIHRDIKPGNIWLDGARRRVKILDFGLARPLDAEDIHLTGTGVIVGTPAYMAPEQARGSKVDTRADLFSLGCVLYQMAGGQLPFRGKDTFAVLTALAVDVPADPREHNPEIPAELSSLILHLLAKNPNDRPATAAEVQARLRDMLPSPVAAVGPGVRSSTRLPSLATDGSGVRGAPGTRIAPAKPRPRGRHGWPRWALPAGVAVGVVFICAGLSVIFTIRTTEGTLHVEVDDPDIEVHVDGTNLVLNQKTRSASLKEGEHKFRVKIGGAFVDVGNSVVLRAEKKKLVVKLGDQELSSGSFTFRRGGTDKFLKIELKAMPSPSVIAPRADAAAEIEALVQKLGARVGATFPSSRSQS